MRLPSRIEIVSETADAIALRRGTSRLEHNLERILVRREAEIAVLTLPDSPDANPYGIVVKEIQNVDTFELEEWIRRSLPIGGYRIEQMKPPTCVPSTFWFRQEQVQSNGLLAVAFDSHPYFGVTAIAEGSSFSGAVFLALCLPDWLFVDTKKGEHGVVMVQIASTPSTECHVIIPEKSTFCVCYHEMLTGGSGQADVDWLHRWYERSGSIAIAYLIKSLD